MTRDRSVDERISAWLQDEAPDQLPDRVLQATFERTRPTRQRRSVLGWRFLSMNRLSPVAIAVGAAAIAIVAIGVVLRPEQPPVGASPTVSLAPSGSAGESLAAITLTGQIVFQQTVDGNTDLFLMNLDRSGLERLTDDPAYDAQPAWTPDGKTLLFTRRTSEAPEAADIYALDIATGVETRLTDLPGVESGPKVSPDGQMIAYEQWPDQPGDYVMNIDGTGARLLFTAPDDTYTLDGWTGDGKALFLERAGVEVLRLDLATKELTSVLSGRSQAVLSVSPDGTAIAFQAERSPGGVGLMNADGTNRRHVTGTWTGGGGGITWSPDGQHLAFANPDGWLYVVRIDGTGLTRWTPAGPSLAWRPQP